jgi:hypothetical protein
VVPTFRFVGSADLEVDSSTRTAGAIARY